MFKIQQLNLILTTQARSLTSISDLQDDSYTSLSSMRKLLSDIQGEEEKKKQNTEDAVPADFLFNKTCCAFRRFISLNTPDFPRQKTANEQLLVEHDQSRWSAVLFTRYYLLATGLKTDLNSVSCGFLETSRHRLVFTACLAQGTPQ